MEWSGGKAGPRGAWVNSWLPQTCAMYVEPFAGMLGVLLQRAEAPTEIVNDLDGRVVNWWRSLRDHPEQLGRLIALTPRSRTEYVQAATADLSAGVEGAAAFTVLMQQRLMRSDVNKWAADTPPLAGGSGTAVPWHSGLPGKVGPLARRLANVQLECADALDLLRRIQHRADAVIYADPPYPDTRRPYAVEVDYAELGTMLAAQRGRVAVSGYATDWDHLGWRAERQNRSRDRVETLWMNYAPTQRRLL